MTGMNRKGKPKTPEEELKKQTLSFLSKKTFL